MAIFNFGMKEEQQAPACTCRPDGACRIQVLGAGCKNCRTLLESTKEAVRSMGLDAEVEYVTDMQKIMESGIMQMPALVVNGRVASMGKVLKPADAEKLLRKMGL